MELMRNLRWMCRVCAVNIRKRRSSSGAVSIFDTPNLLGKLRTYLQMEVEFNDKLPKSICANCFKRIESVHNFAVLAKKTENFLKDFISIAENNVKKATPTRISARFQNEFASFALLSGDKQEIVICEDDTLNGNEDVSITIDADGDGDETFPTLPEKLRFIGVQKTSSRRGKITEKLYGSIEEQNSLEQKRRNLKMVLANNTSQTSQSAEKEYNILAPPTPPGPAALPGLQMSTEVSSYDCLNLGCVIKDLDLLKLILKALKWPFTKETLNAQIHRLKNTRFRDVMVDHNLLQDTDLMQILSSYLSPILLQPQVSNFNVSPSANLNSAGIMPSLEAYKIPADTSVHLVSVPLESERRSRTRQSRQRRRQELRSKMLRIESPIEILSDEETRDVQTFEVNVDPTWYFPAESGSQENSSESLVMSLVGDVKRNTKSNSVKVRKKHRRKEAHVRLHTDRYPDQNMLIVNENGQEVRDCPRKISQKKDQSSDELMINSESLRSQFPLVAIIDENSNDDAIWAEFKVVNSPDHDITREITTRGIEPIQMVEADGGLQGPSHTDKRRKRLPQTEEIKQEIKLEVIDEYDHPEIKTELIEPETILPDEIPPEDSVNTSVENPEQSIELVSIKEEEPEYFEIEEVDIEGTGKEPVVQEEEELLENNVEKEEIESKNPDEEDKEEVAEVIEQKTTRSKSAGIDTAQKTAMTTRSSSRVQNLIRSKRFPRSTTPRVYSAAKKKEGSGRVGRPPKAR